MMNELIRMNGTPVVGFGATDGEVIRTQTIPILLWGTGVVGGGIIGYNAGKFLGAVGGVVVGGIVGGFAGLVVAKLSAPDAAPTGVGVGLGAVDAAPAVIAAAGPSPWAVALVTSVASAATGWVLEEVMLGARKKRRRRRR
jgi:hypothetical protein